MKILKDIFLTVVILGLFFGLFFGFLYLVYLFLDFITTTFFQQTLGMLAFIGVLLVPGVLVVSQETKYLKTHPVDIAWNKIKSFLEN